MGLFDFLKPKPKFPPDFDDAMKKLMLFAFPGGPKQIEEETDKLHALLQGKLSKKESGSLLRRTKGLLVIAEDKSEVRITNSILGSTNGKLTQNEAHLVYTFLTGVSGPATAGGDGSSAEQAVVISASSSIIGVAEEQAYVERVCGKSDKDFTLQLQMQISQNGRDYDVLTIKLKDGAERSFWFDITAFSGNL